MGKMDVHFSSASDDWETPQDTFDLLNGKFKFSLDVCATWANAKCDTFYPPEVDGLRQNWAIDAEPGAVWMNPPYGREIGKWVRKAFEESQRGATVVCLLPSRTDTAWFQDFCLRGEINFFRGRLKFGGAKNAAPFPSMLVVFKGVS